LAGDLRVLGRPAEAAAASRERGQLWPENPAELYQVACELAQCVPLVARGRDALSPEEQAERQKYADLALETLRQAVAHGFRDLDRLQKEPDLAPLRSRPEFQKFLDEFPPR